MDNGKWQSDEKIWDVLAILWIAAGVGINPGAAGKTLAKAKEFAIIIQYSRGIMTCGSCF